MAVAISKLIVICSSAISQPKNTVIIGLTYVCVETLVAEVCPSSQIYALNAITEPYTIRYNSPMKDFIETWPGLNCDGSPQKGTRSFELNFWCHPMPNDC